MNPLQRELATYRKAYDGYNANKAKVGADLNSFLSAQRQLDKLSRVLQDFEKRIVATKSASDMVGDVRDLADKVKVLKTEIEQQRKTQKEQLPPGVDTWDV
ncbi:MAG: hypothetical protein ACE5GN_06225 [Waddliaceae bacterium]